MVRNRSKRVQNISTDEMANVFSLKDAQSEHKGLNGEFLLYQVILKRLLTEGLTESSSSDIKLSEYFNPDNETDRKILIEFDEKYQSSKAIYWYTRETCIYRLLNKALRTQHIGDLIVFTKFVRDLHYQLSDEQIPFVYLNEISTLKVYRGQLISKDEINRIKYSQGQLLSMNSFLSTSTNRNKALEFALNNKPSSEDLTQILLEINLHKDSWNRPFADIKRLSAFAEEEEVLFMFGSIFRIDQIWEDKKLNIWRAILTLCGDNDSDLTSFEKSLENDLKDKNMLIVLGEYMLQMQKFDQAQSHYQMLLNNNLIKNPLDFVECYYSLAQVNEKKGEYDDAIDHLHLALNYFSQNNLKNSHHQLLFLIYNQLALIYSYQKNYLLSLEYYEKALKLTNQNNYSVVYLGLAKLHTTLNNYTIALDYLLKILNEQSNMHSLSTSKIFIQIANIYGKLNQYNKAMEYFKKALQYQINHLSNDHPDLGYTYNDMALFFLDCNQLDKALDSVNKAFQLQLKSLPNYHLDFGQTFQIFGLIYQKKLDYDKALIYFNKLLENQLKSLSSKHIHVNQTYLLIGNTYLAKKDFQQSLVFFQKLLQSQNQTFKSGNPALTNTYQTIAKIYYDLNDFDQTLIFYQKLLDNELETKLKQDPSLSNTYKTISEIYFNQNCLSKALLYANRLIDTYLAKKLFDEKDLEEVYAFIGKIYLKHSFFDDENLLYFQRLSDDQLPIKSSESETILSDHFKFMEDLHFEKRHLDLTLTYFHQLLDNQLKQYEVGNNQLNNTYQILGNIYLQKESFDQALTFYNKLLDNQTKGNLSLFETYRILANIYLKQENFNQASTYLQRLLNNEYKINDSSEDRSLNNIYKDLAITYLRTSNYNQSIIFYNKLFDKHLQNKTIINSDSSLSQLYLSIGNIFLNTPRFQEYLLEKDEQNQIKLLNDSLLPDSFQILAIMDFNSNETRHLDIYLNYFKKLIKNSSKNNFLLNNLTLNHNNKIIANIYLEKRDFDQALIYFKKLLDYQLELKSADGKSLIENYKIISIIYYEKQNYDQALIYLNKLLNYQLESKIKLDPSLADLYKFIGILFFKKLDHQQALVYFNKSIDGHYHSKTINHKQIKNIYSFIQNIYLTHQDFDDHLFHQHYDDKNKSSIDYSTINIDFIENIHFDKKHVDFHLNYFLKKLSNQQFEKDLINNFYQIIAVIYLKKTDYHQSLLYFNKFLNNISTENSSNNSSLNYIFKLIAFIYIYYRNYQKGFIYLYRFLYSQFNTDSIDHSSISNFFQLIGKFYLEKNFFRKNFHSFNSYSPMELLLLNNNSKNFRNFDEELVCKNRVLKYFLHLLDQEKQMKKLNRKLINEIYLILANIYFDEEDYRNTSVYLNKTIIEQIHMNSATDLLLADTYSFMADLFYQSGKFKQALQEYKAALILYKKIYPSTHYKILNSKLNIFDLLFSAI